MIVGGGLLVWGSLALRGTHRAGDPRPFGASAASGLAATPTMAPGATPQTSPTGSTARRRGTPTRLSIPALHVTAPVRVVGVASDGQMQIPNDVRTVGWYRWSAPPGATRGATVLAGHVDSATQGLGSLFRLSTVTAGARIQLHTSNGATLRYRVVARQSYLKTVVPLASIFSLTGRPRLVVVTCGGVFDAKARSYESNIVVTAVPV